MENDRNAVEEKFYQDVADLLGVENNFEVNPYKFWRTRWNNRKAGNGRYEGHGFVRYFAPTLIHVRLKNPDVAGTYTSSEAALQAIKSSVDLTQKES
jgi:hypothetical protein